MKTNVMKRTVSVLCMLALLTGMSIVRPAAAEESEAVRTAKALSSAYAEVAEKVTPSVVSIRSEKKVKTSVASPGAPMDGPMTPEDMMRRFFEHRGGGRQFERRIPGMGSGVIIDAEGHILTNNHVVEDAATIEVQLRDGAKYDAEVVGTDPKTDLAVIKLKETKPGLPVAALGDSNAIKVGNIVIAIGNPFFLEQTVTAGIVSAKNRSIPDATFSRMMYQNFIQTDASINPGNSGGPLVNLDGEVIAINTAIRTGGGGGSDGVGFAVPINQAKSVVKQLIEKGTVTRGWLGVGIEDLSPDLAKHFENVESGVLVREVYADTPAGRAGMQHGDVIVDFDGKPVADSRRLQALVAMTMPDTRVPVTVVRDGKRVTLQVLIAEQPENPAAIAMGGSAESPRAPGTAESELLGLEVQSLDDDLRKQFGLPEDEEGVVVTEVDPDGHAYRAGIRRGVVILEVDRKPIASAEDFKTAEKALTDKDTTLLYVRQAGSPRYVPVKLK